MQCGGKTESDILLAAMRPGETPVPIPNTTVKTGTADGTMLETAWESRWLPDFTQKQRAMRKTKRNLRHACMGAKGLFGFHKAKPVTEMKQSGIEGHGENFISD